MAARPASSRPHILIVSDDTDLADFLGDGLLVAGFWTSTVASPFQALEVFRVRGFDLLLVDAGLGGFGAGELVRRLRGRPSGGAAASPARTDIPIVLLAADRAEIGAGVAGADEMIVAPFDIEQLAPRLFALVGAWREANPDRP